MHGEERSRTSTARRAALLAAYSLGGGAVVTVLGATVAGASGDADATGNKSTTGMTQTMDVDKPAAPTVVDLGAGVGNLGAAGANTGVNTGDDLTTGGATAGGNESDSTVGQHAGVSGSSSGPIVVQARGGILNLGLAAANTGFNDGEGIHTGWASASGNRSSSLLGQSSDVSGAGSAPVVIGQSAGIGNVGLAGANTGINTGEGIDTGNAGATGNAATNDATQAAASRSAMEAAAVQQRTRFRNVGVGLANTGVNESTGDDSTNIPE